MDISLKRLEQALADEEFFLEYLPIIDLHTNLCVGAEALIRWRLDGELVSPEKFIPITENTPLSGLITYWIIEQIGKEMLPWLKQIDDIYISFNVPPEILGRGGVWYAAKKSGLLDVKEKLVVEITERGVPDKQGIDALSRDRDGIRMCLDDVGVSPENLVLYSRLNIDIIKLDKNYADEILKPDWTPIEIMSLTALAHSTKINIIAEGIETEYQYDIFRKAGIRYGQGWYFSKSISAANFKIFFNSCGEKSFAS